MNCQVELPCTRTQQLRVHVLGLYHFKESAVNHPEKFDMQSFVVSSYLDRLFWKTTILELIRTLSYHVDCTTFQPF